jgi:hypothetical protein
LIQDGDDLRHLIAYVHLNPVVAEIEKDPADYRMSGHRAIIGRSDPVLVDVDFALRCFEEETKAQARQAYLHSIRCVAESKWVHESVRGLPWWEFVRDDYQTVTESVAPPEARTFDDKYPDIPPAEEEFVEQTALRKPLFICRQYTFVGLDTDTLVVRKGKETLSRLERHDLIELTSLRKIEGMGWKVPTPLSTLFKREPSHQADEDLVALYRHADLSWPGTDCRSLRLLPRRGPVQ